MIYRVMLGEYGYSYIQFNHWALALRKINQRSVICVECGQERGAGECVFKSKYMGNGYVCLPCAKGLLIEHGERGYSENVMCNLQANFTMDGTWSAEQVIEALRLVVFRSPS